MSIFVELTVATAVAKAVLLTSGDIVGPTSCTGGGRRGATGQRRTSPLQVGKIAGHAAAGAEFVAAHSVDAVPEIAFGVATAVLSNRFLGGTGIGKRGVAVHRCVDCRR
jgi:hypothetical protein